MDFEILTIFPDIFASFFAHGIIRRAIAEGVIRVSATDIRDYAEGRHRQTDDRPYGGGAGMVMKPEPLGRAIEAARKRQPGAKTVLLSPQGRRFDQATARELACESGLILICGRYEGVDERVRETAVDEEISIGDYVLTGGEPAAMVIVDAVTRLLPGALGARDSAEKDSFSEDLLEHAHYTRPPEYVGKAVPDVLFSGDHAAIARWRFSDALLRTLVKRPDLLENRELGGYEKEVLKRWCRYIEKLLAQ
ncbi:MAG: tRNA (guanosine(37)-N1)-methyltransferase TrmD [Desulfosalsimonadaceae bacterium]